MTMDGGIYDSKYRGDCAKLASDGVSSAMRHNVAEWCVHRQGGGRGECVCVDPCSTLNLPACDEWGHESLLSGCESCVPRTNSNLRFEGWAMGGTPTHGYCGNSCVSGNRNGPSKNVLEDCGDVWDWTLHIAIVANQRPRRSLGGTDDRLIPTGHASR